MIRELSLPFTTVHFDSSVCWGAIRQRAALEDVSMALQLLIPTRTAESFQKSSLAQRSSNTLAQ